MPAKIGDRHRIRRAEDEPHQVHRLFAPRSPFRGHLVGRGESYPARRHGTIPAPSRGSRPCDARLSIRVPHRVRGFRLHQEAGAIPASRVENRPASVSRFHRPLPQLLGPAPGEQHGERHVERHIGQPPGGHVNRKSSGAASAARRKKPEYLSKRVGRGRSPFGAGRRKSLERIAQRFCQRRVEVFVCPRPQGIQNKFRRSVRIEHEHSRLRRGVAECGEQARRAAMRYGWPPQAPHPRGAARAGRAGRPFRSGRRIRRPVPRQGAQADFVCTHAPAPIPFDSRSRTRPSAASYSIALSGGRTACRTTGVSGLRRCGRRRRGAGSALKRERRRRLGGPALEPADR